LIICVRLVPNIGGVLKEVLEVEDVQIGVVLETTNVVLMLEVIVFEFEVTEVVQDTG
jgi:hypothetical protein